MPSTTTQDGQRNHGLSLSDAVPLAYAMVDRLGEQLGIRTILFKGPIAELQGYRSGKVSSDVDVLVEPSSFAVFVAALQKVGWKPRREAVAPRYFPTHSVSLLHESWPCDIDVHHRYPGFFADDELAFEALWEHRDRRIVANVEVTCADELTSGLILGAHSLRDPSRTQSVSDLDSVVQILGDAGSTISRSDILEVATRLRARTTLRPLLARLGVDAGVDDLTPEEKRSWELVVAGSGSTAFHWWIAFGDASVLGKIRVLFDAVAALRAARADERSAGVSRGTKPTIRYRVRATITDIRRSQRTLAAHRIDQ